MGEKVLIQAKDIREGDIIRFEWAPKDFGPATAVEYVAKSDAHVWRSGGGDHFLLERPKPVIALPTGPGYFFDCDGDPLRLIEGETATGKFAPYTRLRDEAEVAAEVYAEMLAEYRKPDFDATFDWAASIVAARWATR